MHQSMWSTRVAPVGRLRGYWYLKISSIKTPTLICTFYVSIPSISYPRRWESLYFKCQIFPWVWTPLSQPPGWDIRKLSEYPEVACGPFSGFTLIGALWEVQKVRCWYLSIFKLSIHELFLTIITISWHDIAQLKLPSLFAA